MGEGVLSALLFLLVLCLRGRVGVAVAVAVVPTNLIRWFDCLFSLVVSTMEEDIPELRLLSLVTALLALLLCGD